MDDEVHGVEVDVRGQPHLVIVSRKDDEHYVAFGEYRGHILSTSGKSTKEALTQWRDSAERRR